MKKKEKIIGHKCSLVFSVCVCPYQDNIMYNDCDIYMTSQQPYLEYLKNKIKLQIIIQFMRYMNELMLIKIRIDLVAAA